jgi:hypothetical protein
MTYVRSISSYRAPALLLVTSILGCSSSDLVLPQAGTDIHLTVVSGNQQTGSVGEPLPKPLTIELRDDQGHVVIGRKVAFVATGGPASATLSPATAVTDGDGQAVGQWVLGTTPGTYTSEARVLAAESDAEDAELPMAEFTASAQAGAPDTLRAESETSQPFQQAGKAVEEAPVVRVTDRYGNPVVGATVHWQVTSGEGSVSAESVLTDAEGRATVTWTLGDGIGVHRLAASVDGGATGSPVVFTAVVFP